MPTTVTVQRPLDHAADAVWAVVRDFAGTADWNPEVVRSEAVGDGRRTGVGAVRRCDLDHEGRSWTEERLVAFDDAARRWTLRIEDGPGAPPIDDVRAEMVVVGTGAGTSTVAVHLTLTGSNLVQRLAARVAVLPLRRVFGRVLAGLDAHLARIGAGDAASPALEHDDGR